MMDLTLPVTCSGCVWLLCHGYNRNIQNQMWISPQFNQVLEGSLLCGFSRLAKTLTSMRQSGESLFILISSLVYCYEFSVLYQRGDVKKKKKEKKVFNGSWLAVH